MNKPEKISNLDWDLLQKKYQNLDLIIEKINNNYPVQYLIGNVSFYGYQINVNPYVLIPRFETEVLVEKTIEYINKLGLNNGKVLEIGTGSGCISVVLKKEVNNLEIDAIDISRNAIRVAKGNAKLNDATINFISKDMFKFNSSKYYDVIVSNPPYISPKDNVSANTKYEPYQAIYTDKPLKYYEQIFKIAKSNLNKKFLIALEIDEEEGYNLKMMAKEYFIDAEIVLNKDLAGKDRYLFVINE